MKKYSRDIIIESSGFGEPNYLSTFSETFSAEKEVVLADQTHLACALSAFSAIFSVFSRVGSPEQVWHLWLINNYLYLINIISIYPTPSTHSSSPSIIRPPHGPAANPPTSQAGISPSPSRSRSRIYCFCPLLFIAQYQ